jgi:phage/plasmid-like protein (TIGR03299 family)
MPANVQAMAYAGEVPWHGLGQRVAPGVHATEMIKAAGLDWTVEKRPARGAKPVKKLRDGTERYTRYEIVRMPRADTEEQEVTLGMVTDKYQPLQNCEAFEFFDPIVDQKAAYFETAGALGEGERVWVLAKMPDVIQVVRGDECQKYLLLSNTHSGQGAVIVKFTAIRVVCQNTLLFALQDGQQAFRVRHSKIMTHRLREINDLIAAANEVYGRAAELMGAMAKTQLTSKLLDDYLQAVLPKSEAQRKGGQTPPKWLHIRELLETTSDLQMDGVRGTLWAAYNAVTRFEDYRQVRDEVAGARLDRVWFGSGAAVKLRAIQAASDLMQAM